jgi:hypothetical protein
MSLYFSQLDERRFKESASGRVSLMPPYSRCLMRPRCCYLDAIEEGLMKEFAAITKSLVRGLCYKKAVVSIMIL